MMIIRIVLIAATVAAAAGPATALTVAGTLAQAWRGVRSRMLLEE